MITLLLTATMCHALNIQNSRLFITEKEASDDNAVKKFENTAHAAHEMEVDALGKQLKSADSLLLGLRNHKSAYKRTNNPRQAARTDGRIKRLEAAIRTINSTITLKENVEKIANDRGSRKSDSSKPHKATHHVDPTDVKK